MMVCDCFDNKHKNCKIYAILQRHVSAKPIKNYLTKLFLHSTFLIVKMNNIDFFAADINMIDSVGFRIIVENFIFAVKPFYIWFGIIYG